MLNRTSLKIIQEAFSAGIRSVQPCQLMKKNVSQADNHLIIQNKKYPLKDTYVVGFGKAVFSMCVSLEQILQTSSKSSIKKCILSVPKGFNRPIAADGKSFLDYTSLTVHEGASDNLPDDDAMIAAQDICTLVSSLDENHFLIILISGGGSALLPLPMTPLTLQEKRDLIKKLSISGASIEELNTIRRAVSSVKGGKLAQRINCKSVCLIISDVIDNDLNIIASGPTVPNSDQVDMYSDILNKYNIPMTTHLRDALRNTMLAPPHKEAPHIENILIGTNRVCLTAVKEYFLQTDTQLKPVVVSCRLSGVASEIGCLLAQFSFTLLTTLQTGKVHDDLATIAKQLQIEDNPLRELLHSLSTQQTTNGVCVLFGGETTVVVKGPGAGGRNQELVLSASLELEKLSQTNQPNGEIVLLSGGTDGIDGPTDAAGAITYYSKRPHQEPTSLSGVGRSQHLHPEEFLANNNSYEYFRQHSNGLYHIKTGHTGTNVMDVQLLWIKKH